MAATGFYAKISVLLLVAQSLSIPFVSSFTQAYAPGVSNGDWVFYGDIHSPDNIPPFIVPPQILRDLSLAQSIRLEVLNATTPAIVAKQSWQLRNQTDLNNDTLTGNVQTGDGNLTGWIVAGGLHANDTVPVGFLGLQSPRINATLQRTYWGTNRTVNLLDSTQPVQAFPGLTLHIQVYWDQLTGFLLEAYITLSITGFYNISITGWLKATDTSLWPNPNRPKFAMTVTPDSIQLQENTQAGLEVRLTNTGTVSASISITSGAFPSGSTITPAAWQVTLPPGQNASFTSAVHAGPPGDYSVSIVAQSGSVFSRAKVSLLVTPIPDFTLKASPSQLRVKPGYSGTLTLTLSSLYGFNGKVDLKATDPDPGPKVRLEPEEVSVAPSITTNITLTIHVADSLSNGDYDVTIAGNSNRTSHTVVIRFFVEAAASRVPSASNGILGISLEQFYVVIAAIIGVTAASGYALRRRRIPFPAIPEKL